MIKKYLLLVVLTLMAATTMVASTWKIHNYYVTSMIRNVIDTDHKVYYLNSGQLYQYDKTTQVTTALNRHNLLSDDHIRQIYYDYEKKMLFCDKIIKKIIKRKLRKEWWNYKACAAFRMS